MRLPSLGLYSLLGTQRESARTGEGMTTGGRRVELGSISTRDNGGLRAQGPVGGPYIAASSRSVKSD